MKIFYSFAVFILSACLAGVATPAIAQTDTCRDLVRAGINSEAEIEPCTREILSGRRKGADLSTSYVNRGILYEIVDNFDRAFADYDQGVRANPNNGYAYANRGDMYLLKKQHTLAFADFAKAVQLGPNNADILNVRCWALGRSNADLEVALKDCNRAAEIKPDGAYIFKNRGFVHYRLGNYDRAIADFNKAMDLRKRYAAALHLRGLAKLKLGDNSGDADIAAAAEIDSATAKEYAGYGVTR